MKIIYNHLGSKAVEVDSVGNIIDYVQYSPFGEPLKKNNYQPQWNKRLRYIDKEKDRESKLGDHGVRKYDYEIGRFTSVDSRWEKYTGWTGYQYSLNNPVIFTDPSGLSTITSQKGDVVSVFDDNDNSIYRRDDDEFVGPVIPGHGTTKMGQTYYWDEFINPETKRVFGKIEFGESWENTLKSKNQEAMSYVGGLISIAYESLPGGSLDIKSQDNNFNKGKILKAQATGQPSFLLEASGKDIFTYEQAGVVIEFKPTEKIMILKQGGGKFTFTKE